MILRMDWVRRGHPVEWLRTRWGYTAWSFPLLTEIGLRVEHTSFTLEFA